MSVRLGFPGIIAIWAMMVCVCSITAYPMINERNQGRPELSTSSSNREDSASLTSEISIDSDASDFGGEESSSHLRPNPAFSDGEQDESEVYNIYRDPSDWEDDDTSPIDSEEEEDATSSSEVDDGPVLDSMTAEDYESSSEEHFSGSVNKSRKRPRQAAPEPIYYDAVPLRQILPGSDEVQEVSGFDREKRPASASLKRW